MAPLTVNAERTSPRPTSPPTRALLPAPLLASPDRSVDPSAAVLTALLENAPHTDPCCRLHEAAAILRWSGSVSRTRRLTASLDRGDAAIRLRALVEEICAQRMTIRRPREFSGDYQVVLVGRRAHNVSVRTGLLIGGGHPVRGVAPWIAICRGCDAAALWRGAIIARGIFARRGALLRVPCPTLPAAIALIGAARRLGIEARHTGTPVVEVRSASDVTALLEAAGAAAAAQTWMTRQPRPRRHPQSAGAANVSRALTAAAAMSDAAEKAMTVLDAAGVDVDPDQRAAVELRLQHRTASLRELAAMADPPVSKDTLSGRLRRVLAHASEVTVAT